MFVNIMQYPPIQAGREDEFRQWFTWSNGLYSQSPGFIRRRLLKPLKQGNYVAVVEHESYETFIAMHNSPAQTAAHKRLKPLLVGGPSAQFYELIEG